jgi:hypothetical protein
VSGDNGPLAHEYTARHGTNDKMIGELNVAGATNPGGKKNHD